MYTPLVMIPGITNLFSFFDRGAVYGFIKVSI